MRAIQQLAPPHMEADQLLVSQQKAKIKLPKWTAWQTFKPKEPTMKKLPMEITQLRLVQSERWQPVRDDFNFCRLAFFVAGDKLALRFRDIEQKYIVEVDGQKFEALWEVRHDSKLGLPGGFDRDVWLGILEIVSEITGGRRPIPERIEIGSFSEFLKRIRGSKVETKHGEKWFVAHSELAMEIAPAATMLEPVTAGSAEPVTCASAPVTDASEQVPGMPVDLIARIRELEAKLEGATFRNGYLEAENEGLKSVIGIKDSHIKLLTDSQHKRGWWSQFSAWFMTGR